MKRLIVVQVMLLVATVLVGYARAEPDPARMTEARVDAAIEELENPESRMAALERLIEYCSDRLYNPHLFGQATNEEEKLEEKAVAAIRKQANFATISAALNTKSETLQYWAVGKVGSPSDKSALPWVELLPRLQELARQGSENIRGRSQERLAMFEGQARFLEVCAASETSLANIMRLVYGGNGKGLADRFRPHVWRLLNHEQAEVRHGALIFIGFNRQRAPMWRFKFEDRVFRKVLELSASTGDKERAAAMYALEELRSLDPNAVRSRAVILADDPCEDVRWRLPGVVRDQTNDPEVKQVLDKLLHDPSPNVRYFTIMVLGPAKHLVELRELAGCADKKVADRAKGQLKRLEEEEEE